LAYETGITEVVDPLGGSYYIEVLTNKIEEEMQNYLKKIEAAGGLLKAVETGWAQEEVRYSAFIKDKEIDEGKRIIVGVNKFGHGRKPDAGILKTDPQVLEYMKSRLKRLREERNNSNVRHCLETIRKAAQGKDNLVPFVIEAVKSYVTIGEICGALRSVFGEYHSKL